jgi:Na+/H+ antiporter NhaB
VWGSDPESCSDETAVAVYPFWQFGSGERTKEVAVTIVTIVRTLFRGVVLERMSEERDGRDIPEDEQDVVATVEEDKGSKLSEQERNLAIAQAKLIGDID